ncbi:MAG: hypothetical protein O8C62_11790 [Candidatus Methanoperedens sp.]|nr:hypothetical protein [Candidatus Methanoperedens sp.]
MKPLKFYIESGLVRQGSKDPGEAKAMITDSERLIRAVVGKMLAE